MSSLTGQLSRVDHYSTRFFALAALLNLLIPALTSAAPRELYEVTRQDLEQRVIKAVKSSPQFRTLELAEVKPPFLAPQRLPKGAQLKIEVVGEVRGGRVPVSIQSEDQGRILRRLRVFVKVDFYATGWVLNQNKAAGDLLSQSDLISVRLPSQRLSRDVIRDPQVVEGARLRRSVSAQVPLRQAWLSIPPLVKRGAIVDLIFERGGISLLAQGTALSDARRGARVQVKNLKSKKIVTGLVIGINRVDVTR
jgi:flagella basal body P-ring formation protein FlgA